MGSGEIPRQLSGKLEEANRGKTRRRGSSRCGKTEEARAGRRSDGGPEAKPRANGRKKETGGDSDIRRASRCRRKIPPSTWLSELPSISLRRSQASRVKVAASLAEARS